MQKRVAVWDEQYVCMTVGHRQTDRDWMESAEWRNFKMRGRLPKCPRKTDPNSAFSEKAKRKERKKRVGTRFSLSSEVD